MCVWQPLSVAVRAPHGERSSEAHRGMTGGALGPAPDPAPGRSRSQHCTLRSPLVVHGGSGSLRLVCAGLGPAAAYHTGSVANKKPPQGVGGCLCASLLMQCQIRIFHWIGLAFCSTAGEAFPLTDEGQSVQPSRLCLRSINNREAF